MSIGNTQITGIGLEKINEIVGNIDSVKTDLNTLNLSVEQLLGDLNNNIKGEVANNLLSSYSEKFNVICSKIVDLLGLLESFVNGQMSSYSTAFEGYEEDVRKKLDELIKDYRKN